MKEKPEIGAEPPLSDEEIELYLSQEEDEEEEAVPSVQRKWMKRLIALTLSILLMANILALLPQIYSLPAIQFLAKSRELSQNEQIQQYKRAVVVVKSADRKGTGFNISEQGMIITNSHVVGDEKTSIVSFPDGKSYISEVTARDEKMDIAILQVKEQGLPTLDLASGAEEQPGTPVYVIGNPLFFHGIVNEGHILGTMAMEGRLVTMLTAPIYKGNSGSPVITDEGKVIAVVFATTKVKTEEKENNVGLAVPISDVLAQFDLTVKEAK